MICTRICCLMIATMAGLPVATEVRRQKAQCAACLYLNAGDLVQGTPVSTLFHGSPIYEISNLLGFDAATLGNHEFDYGWRRTQEFLRIAKYPIVSANIVDAEGKTMTRPYVIQNVGGLRVGIIGAILGDLVGTVITKESAGPWRILPVVDTVRKYAQELSPHGFDRGVWRISTIRAKSTRFCNRCRRSQ